MQKEVGNKTLGGYLRRIDIMCCQLKLCYQVEYDSKAYAVNIFKPNADSMDVLEGEKLHIALLNAVSFLKDEIDSLPPPATIEVEKDECSDQAELTKNYKEPEYIL